LRLPFQTSLTETCTTNNRHISYRRVMEIYKVWSNEHRLLLFENQSNLLQNNEEKYVTCQESERMISWRLKTETEERTEYQYVGRWHQRWEWDRSEFQIILQEYFYSILSIEFKFPWRTLFICRNENIHNIWG